MRVAAFVPTRGEVWWETASRMTALWAEAVEQGVELSLQYAQGNRGVVEVRNLILDEFLASESDVLLMVDDDVVPPPGEGLLTMCKQALLSGFQVVGAPCPIVRPGTAVLPNVYAWDERAREASIALKLASGTGLQECDAVGFGCVALARPVCAKLKHFKMRAERGQVTMGEDIDFCLRARSQGFKVAVNLDVPCEHMLHIHGNAIAFAYSDIMRRVMGAVERDEG